MAEGPRFLISRLSALGDTVCSLPAAVALKRSFPGCHITWAVDPRFAAVVEACPSVDEVVRVKPSHRSLPVVEGEFDAALDLQGLLKSALIVHRAKAKRKVGFHWQREFAWLFSERIVPDPTSWHVVDQYVDVARALGAEMDRAEFDLAPRPEALDSVRTKLAALEVGEGFVVMNAGAGWVSKRWPPSHFAAVADALDRPVVMLGGPAAADREAAAEVLSSSSKNRPFSLVGETNVAELIALISLAQAHLGGDTGSTHLAAAMDLPAIGLYSITRPARSGPYGQIERAHHHPGSLAQIEPEAVIETLREALR